MTGVIGGREARWGLAVAICAGALMLAAGPARAAAPPKTATGGATKVAKRSARLHGAVNSHGQPVLYRFEYGLSTAYGLSTRVKGLRGGKRARRARRARAFAGRMAPGTVYHYRLVASNGSGTSYGADRTLKTVGPPLPGVTTGAAASVGHRSATLTGAVNPIGGRGDARYYFDFGPSPSYGLRTPAGAVPAVNYNFGVSHLLQGLAPGTTFHFRLVARNASGPTLGNDQVFVTMPKERWSASVSAHVSPSRERHHPLRFKTTGRLRPRSSAPDSAICSGRVSIRWRYKSKTVRYGKVAVTPACTFEQNVQFRHYVQHAPHTLRIGVRFLGNHYIKGGGGPTVRHARLG